MSTELETPKTATPETQSLDLQKNGSPGPVGAVSPKPKLWSQRRVQIGAGLVLALLLAGVIGNNALAAQYTPEGTVRHYLSAIQAGDAAGAWADIQVMEPSMPVAIVLTDQAAMRASLSSGKPDFNSFDITGTTKLDASNAIVAVTLATSKGARQIHVMVQRSGQSRFVFYPIWRVVAAPTLLTFAMPAGVSGVTIDGKAIDLGGGKAAVAVLPLLHKVDFAETPLLNGQSVTLDAFISGDQTVPFQPKFSDVGMAKLKSAVKGFFEDICLKQPSANPDPQTCPQSLSRSLGSGQWKLVGDPAQGLALSSQGQNVRARGHFQMVYEYPRASGIQHVPSGGTYEATLLLAATEVKVDHIQRVEALALQRPAGATDQAAKDLVAKAFVQCAAVSAEYVADCPQSAPDVILTDVHWTVTGDPIPGSVVSFDSTTGILTVHGNFSMAVSYKWFGYPKSGISYIKHYDAQLFWDGQALQLITIDGSVS